MSQAIVVGWERALMAAERVKERLRRSTRALDGAGVPYAVAGGNAVAEWVARIDDEAVRHTRDVDLLVRRTDFDAARTALEAAGFIHHHLLDVEVFIDGPEGKPLRHVRPRELHQVRVLRHRLFRRAVSLEQRPLCARREPEYE